MAQRVVDAQPGRKPDEAEKRLAADWLKRIDYALTERFQLDFKRFDRNRKLLRGIVPETGQKMLANLHFANLAMTRPQVYAKDPEFAVAPKKGVTDDRKKAVQRFAQTAEAVLAEWLVKRPNLKKRARRLLTSTSTTAVGWLKVSWQEDKRRDPLIQNQIKDEQDNQMRLQRLQAQAADPAAGQSTELLQGQIRETQAGIAQRAELSRARGLTVDVINSEDLICLDESVNEVGEYERASSLAHRVWMTKDRYQEVFGYAPGPKAKLYTAGAAGSAPTAGSKDQARDLVCVFEVWDQASNRVLHVCEGIEGFCTDPSTPDWTGERWYPFFLVAFNEVEGQFYPLSDIDLTEKLVDEYNQTRDDFRNDRSYALPLNIVRKGGSLTDADVQRIANRKGGDTIVVEGVGGQPIGNDVWSGALAKIDPAVYNTQPARADMEMLIGGGDAARGSVLEAKTATEAEILSQGLRGRSAEKQDLMEDMLSAVGNYSLQILLRKLTAAEVQAVVGTSATWPEATDPETVFRDIVVDVRGGSTGKPDRLQEQDRWTKLLPVIKDAMQQVAELRMQGGASEQQAQAIVALVKETLRRFDERVDLDQFLPPPQEGQEPAQADPMQDPRVQQAAQQMQAIIEQLQQQIADLQAQAEDQTVKAQADVRKAQIAAEQAIEVAKVTAPIEAAAAVEVARIKAEEAARAKAQADAEAAARAEQEAAERAAEEERGPSETDQALAYLMQAQQDMQALLQQLAQPRPRMKVVHDIDPATNRVAQSRLVAEEDAE